MTKPRLLLVGDFAKHSGFARVNESIASHLRDRWDVAVLAINYHGDYTPLQQLYRLYPAWIGGDAHGHGRIAKIVQVEQPDAVLIVGDPWNAGGYIDDLWQSGRPVPPLILYTPVDATGIRRQDAEPLNAFQQVVAYTQFGAAELRRAGVETPIAVIPHGIDRAIFHPVDRAEARAMFGLDPDLFIVLVLDRNQPRKRLDLAFDAFAQFAADRPEARLLYHGALEEPTGWDLDATAYDLGIADKVIWTSRDILPLAGFPPDQLKYVYGLANVKLSATSGEGWGLTTMEAMACGVPNIVPDYAALGEWAQGAAWCVPAPIRLRHVKTNTVGHVPEVGELVYALECLHAHPESRARLRDRGLRLVADPAYDWANIADQFDTVLRRAMWGATPVVAYAAQASEVPA